MSHEVHDSPPPSGEVPETESDSPLRRALERSRRFHRDSAIGGILHLGKISYRELAPTDAVHITIAGSHISAHVDDVSPVKQCADGRSRYSWMLVLVHNVLGIASEVGRRLRGRGGQQRCNLDCEVVWVDDDGTIELSCEEIACHTSTGERTPPTPAVGRDQLTPKRHC
ncbi:MAG TPA: hypothetical protein VHT30_02560 [Acidimicrobiales bacterium]|nr:hypothetical protein [Acidimicrobiales bacterium]